MSSAWDVKQDARSIHFSRDGKYAYILCQLTNLLQVYAYHLENGYPRFDLIDEYSTLSDERDPHDAASALRVSYDGKYVFLLDIRRQFRGMFQSGF